MKTSRYLMNQIAALVDCHARINAEMFEVSQRMKQPDISQDELMDYVGEDAQVKRSRLRIIELNTRIVNAEEDIIASLTSAYRKGLFPIFVEDIT